MSHPLKLRIDLVPQGCWGQNLWNLFTQPIWDSIRRECYHKAGNKCEICNTEGVRLECHEVWHYDSIHKIQKLIGLMSLCSLCHQIKHIGNSGRLASEGKLDWAALVSHFCRVNNCNYEDMEAHQQEAFDLLEVRDQVDEWKLDVTFFEKRFSLPPISVIELGQKPLEDSDG